MMSGKVEQGLACLIVLGLACQDSLRQSDRSTGYARHAKDCNIVDQN
jgi:hypothetical protein